jgi:ribonuclease HI
VLKPLGPMTFPFTIWTDGAARGKHNGHGPASAGFVVRDVDGNHVYSSAWALGPHTNNFAEYTAMIYALNWALDSLPPDLRYVHFKSDSEFMVRQLTGVYAVKSPDILPLYNSTMLRLSKMQGYKIEHVRREFNKEADEICNRVLDLENKTGEKFVEDDSRRSSTDRRPDGDGVTSNSGASQDAATETKNSADSSGDPRLLIRGRES